MKNLIYFFVLPFIIISITNSFDKFAYARKVICIDTGDYRHNGYISETEGWARQIVKPGDVLHVGGALDDCLDELIKGDTLIIITHGLEGGGGFRWSGSDYSGFGSGNGEYPVPPGFDSLNHVVTLLSMCFASYSDDSTRSMTKDFFEEIGGGDSAKANKVSGFTSAINSSPGIGYSGGSAAQRAKADSIAKNNKDWRKNPPVNRDTTDAIDHKKALQNLLDSLIGKGVVKVDTVKYRQPKPGLGNFPFVKYFRSGTPVICDAEDTPETFDQTPPGVMLIENFDYPAGDSLGAHGWINYSGANTNRFMVNPGSLSFLDYPLSNIGNSTILNNTGQDDYKDLYLSASSGSVYAYFLINVSNAFPNGDFFAGFLPSNSTTNLQARVHVQKVGTSSLRFGISKSTGTPAYGPLMFVTNTTLMVVIKYTFRTVSSTDDQASLFVYQNILPNVEPAPYAGPVTNIVQDLPNIARFGIIQSTVPNGPTLFFDGLKVAQSWNSIVLNLDLALQGFYNIASDSHNRTDTFTVELRNTGPPYQVYLLDRGIIDPVTLKGTFEFLNGYTGGYYIAVKFRNGLETWSKSGGEFYTLGGTYFYDFTGSSSQTFGNNTTLIGSRFCIYSGDVNQEGNIDLSDVLSVYNDASNFVTGYVNTDVTGNNVTDLSDILITYNNSASFVGVKRP